MSRTIEVVPYRSHWPSLFRMEARKIAAVLANELILIHHIGSTAIPRIKAKPVIDCLIEVRDIDSVDLFNDSIMALGYDPRGENGIAGRRYFNKARGSIHTHHLHIFQLGHPEIARHLNFRDFLRAHPEQAQAYSRIKEDLAQKFKHDSEAYTEGKTIFVNEIDRLSAAWRQKI